MKTFWLLGLFLAFLLSCTSPESNSGVYKLDPNTWPTQTVALDQVIKEIRVIPLETNPECLISYINDIQYTPEMIVALDGETLRINCFGPDGKFLRKFGTRGKGPGEYSTAIGLLVNQEKSEIILNRSPSPKVNFFNLSGQFLRSNDLEFNGYRMKLIDKDLFAVHAGRFGFNKINFELAIMDMDGKIRKVYYPFSEPIQGDQCFGFAAGTKPGSVLYHKRFDYHVYEVSTDRVDTLLTVDFGAAAIDTGKYLDTEKVDLLSEQDGKILGYMSLTNTPDHLAARIYRIGGSRGTWILDHRSKNHRYLAVDTLYSMGRYEGLPVQWPSSTHGSWFVSQLDGIDWLETVSKIPEAQKVILRMEVPGFSDAEKVTVDGNPVLVLYKFVAF